MFFIFRLLIHMVAILIISYLLPGLIRVDGIWAALVAAFLLGIVNAVSTYSDILYASDHGFDSGPLPARHQWPDALAGILHCERVPCQRLLGAVLGSILISLVSWVLSRFLPS